MAPTTPTAIKPTLRIGVSATAAGGQGWTTQGRKKAGSRASTNLNDRSMRACARIERMRQEGATVKAGAPQGGPPVVAHEATAIGRARAAKHVMTRVTVPPTRASTERMRQEGATAKVVAPRKGTHVTNVVANATTTIREAGAPKGVTMTAMVPYVFWCCVACVRVQ
jgi:hypothetical protein